ncbi:MAG: winged helix-turn-helix domain-containing protein, partial [Bacteroidota bacterium]
KLIIYGSIALGMLVGVQVHWLIKVYDANAVSFDHKVSTALFAAADNVSENVSVEKRSANRFFVTSNAAVTSKTVDTLIQHELAARSIKMDYEIGIYNAEDDSLIYMTEVKSSDHVPLANTRIETDEVQKNFAVVFPTRSNLLIAQNDLFPFALTLVALIIWILTYYRKKASGEVPSTMASNQIRLGNCQLDVHNRSLRVGKSSHQLTYKESQILKLFFEQPNQVIERKVFLEKVWEQDGFFVARSMDVFISKIRKYFKDERTIKIENLRAIGYKLVVSR